MGHRFLALGLLTLAAGCAISPEGIRTSPPPPAIQGSNDVQGSPISVPGAGMGVGAGNPNGISSAPAAPGR